MRKIAALVGIAAIVALGAYTYSAIKNADYMTEMPVSISVTGEGEVVAVPDIAQISFSVTAKESTAGEAIAKSAEGVNAIVKYLKDNGVEEKDIKTQSYNLNPRYEYPDTRCSEWGCPPQGEPKLIGYEVTQTVGVKVRDLSKVGMFISGLGELGVTNVNGPSFTIDDDSTLKADARKQAIEDAREKAAALAEQLGVRIVRMTGYWEEQNYPMPYGMGGGEGMVAAYDMKAAVPDMPAGENTISARVNVTYEIR